MKNGLENFFRKTLAFSNETLYSYFLSDETQNRHNKRYY